MLAQAICMENQNTAGNMAANDPHVLINVPPDLEQG